MFVLVQGMGSCIKTEARLHFFFLFYLSGTKGGTMNNLDLEKIIDLAAKDTKNGPRAVAKVFYSILRKKDFSENQIIDVSTNVLNCLIESLQGYEKKIESVY